MEDNDIIKTTITFNPRVPNEAIVLSHLYEKGKFSTNIKNILIETLCKSNDEKTLFLEMNEEELISTLGLVLYAIDKKGLDISKMVMGYCNIQPQIIAEGIVQDGDTNSNTVNEIEDIEDLTEEVENCGIDLC